MVGETDREQEAKRISGQYGKLFGQVDKDAGFDVDFKPQYGLEDFRGAADTVFDKTASNIGRLTRTGAAESAGRSAQSLASRGITGGSVVDDARSRIEGDIYGQQFNVLENLGINRAGQETGLMNQANANIFGGKQAELNALLSKYGIKSGALGGQGSMLAGFSDDTWLDDVLSVGMAGIYNSGSGSLLSNMIGGGGASAAGGGASAGGGGGWTGAMMSDIKTKENVSLLGLSKSGLPIISFNYIWDRSRRFIGTIAQEVEKINPEAVEIINGMKAVFYNEIDVSHHELR